MFVKASKFLPLLALLALVALAVPPRSGLAQTPDYKHVLYLPYITNEKPVTGRLTSNGSPVAGQTVVLRYSNVIPQDHNDFSSAVTGADGTFSLRMPRMNTSDDSYYLLWFNTGGNPAWLSGFRGREIFGNAPNHHFEINIADVPLVKPDNGASVFSPTTFEWVRRATTSDNYFVGLEDEARVNYSASPGLGYTSRATIGSLPAWIKYNTRYYWFMGVETPAGFGVSFARRAITFRSPSSAPALDAGLRWMQPEPGALLESWQMFER